MPEDWLSQFRKDVDAAVEPARSANAAFELWWKNEQESVTSAPQRLEPAKPDTRLESLAIEREELRRQLEDAKRRELMLQERVGSMERERAAAEVEISRLGLDASNSRAQLKAQEDQLRALRGDKSFLEGAFARLEDRNKALENEVRLVMDKQSAAERFGLEARAKAAELEAELGKLRVQDAAKGGALEELRKQVSVYHERLVLKHELTDSDVNLLRQELRDFLAKLKRM